jgi:hypothetical protein
MKTFLLIALSTLIAFSRQSCHHKSLTRGCFKGRLEIKGACTNYTIKVLEGSMDTSLINASWKDEQTGKVYTNVFALRSRCTFPSSVSQGDEFYFTIDSNYVQRCMVCMIYYPTPEKSLPIKVLTEPCK